MLAIILFSVCLASLKAIELNQPYNQIDTEQLTYTPQSSLAFAPEVSSYYNMKIGQPTIQGSQPYPENCPNLEILRNILDLLTSLSSEDTSNVVKPEEKMQVLTFIKKYIERSGSQNEEKNNELRVAKPASNTENSSQLGRTLYQVTNKEIPKNHIEAKFELKFVTLNADCKDALNVLLQAVNAEYIRLIDYCSRSGNCNYRTKVEPPNAQIDNLSSILSEILNSSKPQEQINLTPQNLYPFNHYNVQNLVKSNQVPNQETNNDYSKPLSNLQLQSVVNGLDFQNIVNSKTEQLDNAFRHNNNAPVNIITQPDSQYKQRNENQKNPHSIIQYDIGNIPLQPYKILNYPEKQNLQTVQSTFDMNFGNVPINPLLQQKVYPSQNDIILNSLNKNSPNKNNGPYQNINTGDINAYNSMYSFDYLKHNIYGNKLFDSQRLASVYNLLKLNSGSDSHGVIELTYVLKRPESVIEKPYYYVKYRLPYKDFVSRLHDVAKTPLRFDPLKLNEKLLPISNLADASPALRNVGTDELTNFIVKSGGTLVNAKVLDTENSMAEKELETVQNLNSQLNTNDILNIVHNDTIPKINSSDNVKGLNVETKNPEVSSENMYFDLHRLLMPQTPHDANVVAAPITQNQSNDIIKREKLSSILRSNLVYSGVNYNEPLQLPLVSLNQNPNVHFG